VPTDPAEPIESAEPIDPAEVEVPVEHVVDSLTLRFEGKAEDGSAIHELRAAHVADVLLGLVGITSDFDKAGVFHEDGPAGSEVLVRPAKEGSFLIEVIRVAGDAIVLADYAVTVANDFLQANGPIIGVTGIPTIGTIITLATKSARAEVSTATHD